jgi:hypothetical protein
MLAVLHDMLHITTTIFAQSVLKGIPPDSSHVLSEPDILEIISTSLKSIEPD